MLQYRIKSCDQATEGSIEVSLSPVLSMPDQATEGSIEVSLSPVLSMPDQAG